MWCDSRINQKQENGWKSRLVGRTSWNWQGTPHFPHFLNLPNRMVLTFKQNWICILTSLCLAELVICMFSKPMCSNTIEYLKSKLLKFKLSWLTSREERMQSSQGSHCLSDLFLPFKSPLLWKYISVGLGLHEIVGMTSYLRRRENESASVFLSANFTQHYSGCVRDGKKKKKGIRDMIFIFKGLTVSPGQREETMTAQIASVQH